MRERYIIIPALGLENRAEPIVPTAKAGPQFTQKSIIR